MRLDATGMAEWEITKKVVLLSYAYDEVVVERKQGKVTIHCKGKMKKGRGG